MKSIYVVVLNYNNSSDTLECLAGLRLLSPSSLNLRIVVVDNASTDESVAQIRQALPDNAVLIENQKNVGYAAGNNVGIKAAVDNNADFICVLNNDTLIEEDFITQCVNMLESDHSIGFVSPVIMEADNNVVQSTGGDIVFPYGNVTVKNHGILKSKLTGNIECDYLGGACLVFRADILKEIGFIPEQYFLFFEETEWCYQAKIKGYKNICITSSYIRHKGSATIDTIGGLHSYLMERNRVVFLRRNSKSKISYAFGVLYLTAKYIWWGIKKDPSYFTYLLFIKDGVLNQIDSKKYPFIVTFQ